MRTPLVLFILALSSLAIADEQEAARVAGDGSSAWSDPRARASTWIVAPKNTLVVGGNFAFLTSDSAPFAASDGELKFTDVGLLNLQALVVPALRLELSAQVELLPKQPSFTDEFVVQNVALGARYAFARRFAASVSAAGGPVIGEGLWGAAGGSIDWKTSLDKVLVVEASGGGLYTQVDPEGASAWLVEVVLGGRFTLQSPTSNYDKYGVGVFVGIDMAFPVAHGDIDMEIDPQTRLNFHVGTTMTFNVSWDLYIDFAALDRGDASNPLTQLPILHGGFDQEQVVFGLVHRFDITPKKKPMPIAY